MADYIIYSDGGWTPIYGTHTPGTGWTQAGVTSNKDYTLVTLSLDFAQDAVITSFSVSYAATLCPGQDLQSPLPEVVQLRSSVNAVLVSVDKSPTRSGDPQSFDWTGEQAGVRSIFVQVYVCNRDIGGGFAGSAIIRQAIICGRNIVL